MRSLIFIFWLFNLPLISGNLTKLYKLYEKQEYEKGCNLAKRVYKSYLDNEKFLTLYGLNCLETNDIDEIAKPMVLLKNTKESRQNASYFGTILLQKQLLKQALIDKRELTILKLPTTNFYLSKIFNAFVRDKYRLEDNRYIIDDNKDSYYLYIDSKERMIIDIYRDKKFLKRYIYK